MTGLGMLDVDSICVRSHTILGGEMTAMNMLDI